MSADTVVETKLTLDDAASDTLKTIRSGFEQVDKQVDHTKSVVAGFGTQFGATLAAVSVAPILHRVGELASSVIDLGMAAAGAEDEIADMVAGMSGTEWALAKAYAQDINEEYNELAAISGKSKTEMIEAQKTLATYMGGSSKAMELAHDNMENMVEVSKVQGVAVQEIAAQFGKMANGMIAMESPIFNLLRGTGIFAANTRDVNEQWQKLTQEERIRRLSGAFESIARNVQKAPTPLEDMLHSVQAIGNEFMETFGQSAISSFTDNVGDLTQELTDTRGEMKSFARDLGKDIGAFVADSVEAMRDAFAYVRTHSDEIRAAIKDGFQFAKDTISWIIGHKTELMFLGGAMLVGKTGLGGMAMSTAGGILGGVAAGAAGAGLNRAGGFAAGMASETMFVNRASSAVAMTGKLSDSLAAYVKAGSPAVQLGASLASSVGGLAQALIAGGPAVWAATAAVGALAAGAVILNNKINEAETERNRVIESNVDEFTKLTSKMGTLTEAELARLDELRSQAEKMASEKLVSERVGEKFEAAWADRENNILKAYIHPMQKIDEAIQRYAVKADEEGLMPEELGAQRMAVNAAARLYENAWKAHNEGAMNYIAKMLGASEEMREAFLTSADMTTEGFLSLAKTVRGLGENFSSEFGGQIENIARAQMDLDAKKAAPQVNFNGGQVFKIQQDFRDQEPDRVAIAFEKRFIGAAISRVQATTSTPFGT